MTKVRFIKQARIVNIIVKYYVLDNQKVEQKDVTAKKNDEGGSYSLSKGLVRLSFSIYLSNYYYIRTDFFSERTFFYNTLYALVSN